MEQQVLTGRLDGEIARRTWGGLSPALGGMWAGVVAVALVTWFVLGGGLVALAVIVVEVGLFFAANYETPHRKSWLHVRTHRYRVRWWRSRNFHVFLGVDDPDRNNPAEDTRWLRPVPVGNCEPVPTEGTGLDDLFILHTNNPTESYFTVVVSVDGAPSGIRGDKSYNHMAVRFGVFLEELAQQSSFVRSVQLLHRSVAHDMTGRWRWFQRMRARAVEDGRLDKAVQSFETLLHLLTPYAQEHRSYVVLRVPQSREFMREAKRLADSAGIGDTREGRTAGVAQLVRDETERAVDLLEAADMGNVRVLSERAVCGTIRAFMDPTHPLDKHKDLDWDNCWLSYVGGEDSVVVAGSRLWHTRVGVVPSRAYTPTAHDPMFLADLLTGVRPDPGTDVDPPAPTVRTVSVFFDLVDRAVAAPVARKDLTRDMARQIAAAEKGQITLGEERVLAKASQRRALDLEPGSGHHGIIFTIAVAVTAEDEDAVRRACARTVAAAGRTGLSEIEWQTDFHDQAQFNLIPGLGRSNARTRWTK